MEYKPFFKITNKTPSGIIQMREELLLLPKEASEEEKLKCIKEIAKSRLTLKGFTHLLFNRDLSNITRDKFTTDFYKKITNIKIQ